MGCGGKIKVKPAKEAAPTGVRTLTSPVAPAPTTAWISVAEMTRKEATVTPPKRTSLAPVKFSPRIVTAAPTPADAGEKPKMRGGCGNIGIIAGGIVKQQAFAVPPGVMTVMVVLLIIAGARTTSVVGLTETIVPATFPMRTSCVV
jgi:hypothetical protein